MSDSKSAYPIWYIPAKFEVTTQKSAKPRVHHGCNWYPTVTDTPTVSDTHTVSNSTWQDLVPDRLISHLVPENATLASTDHLVGTFGSRRG